MTRWLSSIARLLTRRRPAHVARLVMAVVVDAIDRMYWAGPRADVSDERLEGMTPAITNANAAAAIAGIFRILLAVAPLAKVPPASIFWCFVRVQSFARRVAVRCLAALRVLVLQAAARFHPLRVQMINPGQHLSTAVASTEHVLMFAVAVNGLKNDESAEALPDHDWKRRTSHSGDVYFIAVRAA